MKALKLTYVANINDHNVTFTERPAPYVGSLL